MKSNKSYLPATSIYPFRGLNTLDPSPEANIQTSPDLVNMDIVKGALQKRRGYSLMGDTLTDPVIGVTEFEDVAGDKFQLAFTTRHQYKWSGTSWTNMSNTSSTWTGSVADPIEMTPIAGLDGSGSYKKWILVTNGKDTPKYWDGVAAKFVDYAPSGIANFKTYRTAAFFYDHLLLANVTYTSGTPTRNVVYWTDTTKLLDFAGTNGGAALLSDVQGEIVKLSSLGDRMAVYAENSIHTMTYVGGTVIYTFEKIINDTRLVSMQGIVNVSGFHLYLNQENVIWFDGSKILRVMGDQITRTFREELYVNDRELAFGYHDAAKRRIYFSIPTGPASSKVYMMEYKTEDWVNSVWTVHEYNDQPGCMGDFSRDVTLTYDSSTLVGVTYNACNFTYNQGTVKGGFPLRVFGTQDGRVAVCDDLLTADASESIEAYYDTIDFTVPTSYQSQFARWIELEVDAKGFEVLVSYSVNEGQSYTEIQNLELIGSWQKYKIPFDVMSKTLRFRFSNLCVNSKFELRWIRVWLRPGGPA